MARTTVLGCPQMVLGMALVILVLICWLLSGCATSQPVSQPSQPVVATNPLGYYGHHVHGKVSSDEWHAILVKYHASRKGADIGISEDENQGNWNQARLEVERVRELPSN